jgi:hypothetical protein
MIEAIRQEVLLALSTDEVDDTLRAQVDELLADWQREASDPKVRDRVLDLLRDDLLAQLQGAQPADQRAVLSTELADRHSREVSRRSLDAARRRQRGELGPDEAREVGQQLLDELKPLQREVDALADGPRKQELQQRLQEVSLEALFLVDGKVTSPRMQRQASPPPGAPSVIP